jgi:protein transport protein SEC24
MQPSMRMSGMPGTMPPNTLGQGMMPASTPTMPYSPHSQVSTPSKIDPTQIPRPIAERSVIIFETRQGGQAAIPPVYHLDLRLYIYISVLEMLLP